MPLKTPEGMRRIPPLHPSLYFIIVKMLIILGGDIVTSFIILQAKGVEEFDIKFRQVTRSDIMLSRNFIGKAVFMWIYISGHFCSSYFVDKIFA